MHASGIPLHLGVGKIGIDDNNDSFNVRRHGGGHHHHQYITAGGSANRPKFTTRHLAALNFLLNVPMQREAEIREAGLKISSRKNAEDFDQNGADDQLDDGRQADNADDESAATSATPIEQMESYAGSNRPHAPVDAAGIKLKGPVVHTVRYPPVFRYAFNNFSDHSAMVRKWEEDVLRVGNSATSHLSTTASQPLPAVSSATSATSAGSKTGLLSNRIFMCRTRSYPGIVLSIVRYDAGEEKAKLEKIRAEDTKGLEVFKLPERDWRGCSYKALFKPLAEQLQATCAALGGNSSSSAEAHLSGAAGMSDRIGAAQNASNAAAAAINDAGSAGSQHHYQQYRHHHSLGEGVVSGLAAGQLLELGYAYDPNSVDDPSLLHGSHRYVSQRSAPTGPIISSVILFVKKQELKESLNEQFRERHPHLPPSLTLSKIRNLKKQALLAALSMGIEVSTMAIAVLNFERLCLKSIVTKFNRRLSMALSLILAVKFNENVSENYHKKLQALLQYFDREWDLPKKQIFDAEFGAFVVLGFSMHLPYKHIYLSFTRLLKLIGQSSKQYLGDDMNDVYVSDILRMELLTEVK